jgi:hypothetical protein
LVYGGPFNEERPRLVSRTSSNDQRKGGDSQSSATGIERFQVGVEHL